MLLTPPPPLLTLAIGKNADMNFVGSFSVIGKPMLMAQLVNTFTPLSKTDYR